MAGRKSGIVCSVRGCHNNWQKRRVFMQQECYDHRPKTRIECGCGAAYDLHPPPRDKEPFRLWVKALKLKIPPKRPYVCSYHFVDNRPTKEHPFPEKWLGYDAPVKRRRSPPRRTSTRGLHVVCCAAFGCTNRSEKGIHMYAFPEDTSRRRQWLDQVRRSNMTIKSYSSNRKLCEAHFERDQFTRTTNYGKVKLKPDAVPTIFEHSPAPKTKRKHPAARTPLQPPVNVHAVANDHTYCPRIHLDIEEGEYKGGIDCTRLIMAPPASPSLHQLHHCCYGNDLTLPVKLEVDDKQQMGVIKCEEEEMEIPYIIVRVGSSSADETPATDTFEQSEVRSVLHSREPGDSVHVSTPVKHTSARRCDGPWCSSQTCVDETVDIDIAFERWRRLREEKAMESDAEVALYLLDIHQRFPAYSTQPRPPAPPSIECAPLSDQ